MTAFPLSFAEVCVVGYQIRPGKFGFRIIHETWVPARKQIVVPKEAYPALGFRYDMALSDAKLRAKQINKQALIESRKITAIAVRVKTDNELMSSYLPIELANGFYDELKENYADSPHRLVTVAKHWQVAQKVISKLGIDSKDFFTERTRIYNYYRDKKWSPDYIKRINRMLNLWGSFVGRRRGSFYQPIPKLSNLQSQRIVEGRESVKGVRQPALPLSWQSLKSKQASFVHRGLESQYNWLLPSK
ncbi:MAG: hypothetical protein JNL11_08620 [Bdellovibrionaceae bacterium]|nr:hypothetical protein [Pseudobdellovibrionaceae bacterium]